MNIEEYLNLQENLICLGFRDPCKYPIAIEEIESFRAAGTHIQYSITNEICGSKKENAFVRTIDDNHELWVRTGYSLYRNLFKKFLNQYYDVNPQEIEAHLNVDHLCCRGLALKSNMSYVRLALIHENYNKYFGTRVEKPLIALLSPMSVMVKIDYFTILKTLHINFPKTKKEFLLRLDEIVSIIHRKTNENEHLIRSGLMGELEFWPVYNTIS